MPDLDEGWEASRPYFYEKMSVAFLRLNSDTYLIIHKLTINRLHRMGSNSHPYRTQKKCCNFETVRLKKRASKFTQKFFNLEVVFWAQCYKTFYVRNLRIFVLS